MSRPRIGVCYRVQLRAAFTFEDAAATVPYLQSLGVTHLYCSPYLQAVPGSTHGYDVVDPGRLSVDLGGEAGFCVLVAALEQAGLGQVLDIVPNHMAAAPTNRWWWDVLENGPASRYATYFDIDWQGPEEKASGTVLAPILDDHYGRVLEAGALAVVRDGGSFVVRYHDHELPVSPRTLDEVLGPAAARAGSAELAELAELAHELGRLPHAERTDPEAAGARHQDNERLRQRLAQLSATHAPVADAVDAELEALNADPARLDALLERQSYRLAHWRTASEEIDFRRFFNIETLVGLRTEDPRVFADTHTLVLELVRAGTVEGLRVDHVDGLRDPQGYLERLADATAGAYTVVEKILGPDEALPDAWPVVGTTGYEVLNRVNGLFVATENEAALTDLYQRFTGQTAHYDDVVHTAKHEIIDRVLAAEAERLVVLLADVCQLHRRHRDHTHRALGQALREVLASFPVYRTYVHPGRPVTDVDAANIGAAVRATKARRPDLDEELIDFIGQLLRLEHAGGAETELALRFQQLSAPAMAKGAEDTAFYRYHRLISLNEVGGDPGRLGGTVDAFHADQAVAASRWPQAMVTLSTHDTKRSADVRARINLLSELPGPWATAVERWAASNDRYRRHGWPDRNTEYLLYQTLFGAWPIGADRVVAFMDKAVHEAKVHTSWTDPDPAYDTALEAFVRAVLADPAFVADVEGFLAEHRIVELSRLTSLAQTTLLLTRPGVVDLYQGTEVWDLSLVDPDNRRPVDYEQRRRLLERLEGVGPDEALALSEEGGPKLWLIHRLLLHRQERPAAEAAPTYEPLAIAGVKARHAVAFAHAGQAVVVPRLVATLGDWGGTSVTLPEARWTNVLTGETVRGGDVALSDLLHRFPVAVLARDVS